VSNTEYNTIKTVKYHVTFKPDLRHLHNRNYILQISGASRQCPVIQTTTTATTTNTINIIIIIYHLHAGYTQLYKQVSRIYSVAAVL
jgi:hypothetical protein